MRFRYLELTNWCNHDNLAIDISEGLQVEGRNGTGKSSLLEAIRFIFKETARGYSNRIKNGQRFSKVSLTFDEGGINYRVEKFIFADKPSTALMLADGIQIADNPSSVYQRIQTIIPEDVFDRLLYIPQGGLTSVLDRLSGKEGKIEMDRLFGLYRLETVWERSGTDIQVQEAEFSQLVSEKGKYPEDAPEFFKNDIEILEKQLFEIGVKTKQMSFDLETVKDGLEGCNIELKAMLEARATLERIKNEKSNLEMEEIRSSSESETIRERIRQIQEKKAQLQRLKAAYEDLKRYAKIREILQGIKAYEDKIKAISDIKEKKIRLSEITSTLSERDDIELKFQNLSKELKEAQTSMIDTNSRLSAANDYYRQFNCLQGKVNCPKCGQRINAFIVEKHEREAKATVDKLKTDAFDFGKRVDELAEKSDALEKKLQHIKEAQIESHHLEKELALRQESVEKLGGHLSGLRDSLRNLGHMDEDLDYVEGRYDELKRLEGQIQTISKEVIDVGLDERLRLLMDSTGSIRKRLNILNEQLSSIRYDEKTYIGLSTRKDALSEGKHRIEIEISNLQNESKMKREGVERANKSRDDYNRLMECHARKKNELDLTRRARDVFHRDKGLVRFLRDRFIHSLNLSLTGHFKRFNQNSKYSNVCFDKEYNLVINTTEGVIDSKQLSGGELVQLAISLRIALIELMSPSQMLIIDEPFGSLDEPHREALGESLNKIAENGQLIIVTHIHVESLQMKNVLDLGGY